MLYALRERGAAAPIVLEPLGQNIRNYMRVLWINPVLRHLIISTAAAEILGFSHQVVLPVLVKDVLHADAASLGVLTAFRFIGGTVGVIAMMTFFTGTNVGLQGYAALNQIGTAAF